MPAYLPCPLANRLTIKKHSTRNNLIRIDKLFNPWKVNYKLSEKKGKYLYSEMAEKPIILFDGACNLCNSSVQFIIIRDKKKQFFFAQLQGKTGQEILAKFNLPLDDFNSFILSEGDKIYTKSTGALRMLQKTGGVWSLFYGFIIIPKFIRDGIYNLIARNRYKWFGKRETCMIPTPELKQRFLD